MKNSNDSIGNRTRDLPACSAVPQPSATLEINTVRDPITDTEVTCALVNLVYVCNMPHANLVNCIGVSGLFKGFFSVLS